MASFSQFLAKAVKSRPVTSIVGAAMTASGVGYQQWVKALIQNPPWYLTNHIAQLLLIGIGVLILAYVFWAEAQREIEVLKGKSAARLDLPLLKVVARIVNASENDLLGPDHWRADLVNEALQSIRENALTKNCRVFGRRGVVNWKMLDQSPRQEIDSAYWSNHWIDYLRFVADENAAHRGQTDHAGGGEPGPIYYDLWFDASEVDKIWPKRSRKISWRWPLVLKDQG